MTASVLVTGALGNVGAEIVKCLIGKNVEVRAGDINTDALKKRFGDGIEAVRFDYAHPETFADTFKGIKRMFLMRPPQITDTKKYMFPAIDAAKAAGVEQVVFLSLIGIEQNTRVPHYPVEQHLLASGMAYTFLRCSFFMQNLSTTHRAEIRDGNELFVPVGKGKTSFLDVRDIAAVATLALTEAGHENKKYDLTGGESLDYFQVADIFSQVLGRPIVYRNPSDVQFLWKQVRKGTKLPFAVVMTWLYSSTRNGMADVITAEVPRLLGRPAITLKQFVQDNKEVWMPQPAGAK